MSSQIVVKDIFVEDLFKWFYEHVIDSCGDGCGIIVCENYKEVADWFSDWFKEKYEKEFYHKPDTYGRCVNFHNNNENFIFTDNKNINNWNGDYIFIVQEDCWFGRNVKGTSRKILGLS